MSVHRYSVVALLFLLTACASSYTLVSDGSVTVGDLRIQAGPGWNQAPKFEIPWARRSTQTWTRDGMPLDRLIIIPRLFDGESIFFPNEDIEYPVFKANMTPAQIQALVIASLELAQGPNPAVVNTDNLRPYRFGNESGVLFDFGVIVHDGPEYAGTAGAFVANERLYLLYFVAAVPYYFDKHIGAAEAVIRSARL